MLKFKFKGIEKAFKLLNKEVTDIAVDETDERADELLKNLKDATPIDEGRARDGWKITVSREDTLSDEAEVIIENNVPYIDELNRGSSKQAGPRFIERETMKLFEPDGVIVKRKRS